MPMWQLSMVLAQSEILKCISISLRGIGLPCVIVGRAEKFSCRIFEVNLLLLGMSRYRATCLF